MNGTPLPNWVRLIGLGFLLAGFWFAQQNAVSELQKGQIEIRDAVKDVRMEIRDKLVTQTEFSLLSQRVESNARRIDSVENKLGMKSSR